MARLKRRLPGNTTTVHYVRRNPSIGHCPISGQKINGVPRLRPSQMRKLPRSQRSVNRPFGGKISHKVLAEAIQEKILESYLLDSEPEN
jgi:large subunit ribosomal protein L34e